MLLVIDVGNSNNVIGLFSEKKLLSHWRIRTEWNRTADEYWVLFKEFVQSSNVEPDNIDDIVIACVVPSLVPVLQEMAKKYFSSEPLIVGPGIKTGISILYRNPAEVGADRIVNSVAAYEKYGGPLIIVDFGTATTFDVVSKKGEYLGGVIFPGIQISLEALFKHTAKLPRIDMLVPEKVIGKSTVESICFFWLGLSPLVFLLACFSSNQVLTFYFSVLWRTILDFLSYLVLLCFTWIGMAFLKRFYFQ